MHVALDPIVCMQVTVVVLSVIIFAILGELYTERGSMLSTAIFVYAATSPINGYAGGGLYARMGGRVWIKQMILSAFMLPLMVCGTAFFINFIAMYYHASRAIPFGSMVRSSFNSTNSHTQVINYIYDHHQSLR